jgi:hypothetical protein
VPGVIACKFTVTAHASFRGNRKHTLFPPDFLCRYDSFCGEPELLLPKPSFRDRDPLCVAAIGNKQKLALNGKVGINHPGPAVVQVHVRDLHGLILLCRTGRGLLE